jgi:hypothetical protein
LYPDAAGGPLTYTAPGQPFFESERSRGGWYQAPVALTATIERIVSAHSAPAAGPATASTDAASTDAGRAWWPFAVGAATVLLVAGGIATFGRRRVRMSPV